MSKSKSVISFEVIGTYLATEFCMTSKISIGSSAIR